MTKVSMKMNRPLASRFRETWLHFLPGATVNTDWLVAFRAPA